MNRLDTLLENITGYGELLIQTIKIRPEDRHMDIMIRAERHLSLEEEAFLSRCLTERYLLRTLKLTVTYPGALLDADGFVWLAARVCAQYPFCAAFLAGSRWNWRPDTAVLSIETRRDEGLFLKDCGLWMTKMAEQSHGVTIQLQWQDAGVSVGEGGIVYTPMGEQTAVSPAAPAPVPSAALLSPAAPAAPTPPAARPRDRARKTGGKKITPMKDLTAASGVVTVEGLVFKSETTPNKKLKEHVNLHFCLADGSSAVRVRYYPSNRGKAKPLPTHTLASLVSAGRYLRVTGRMREPFRDGDDEPYLELQDAVETERPRRMDDAPEKRVELHMHSNMSALDATADVRDIVETAARWGHSAVAITDHGVVHAFPAAMQAAGKHKPLKMIYGCEGYLFDDEQADIKKTYHVVLLVQSQKGLLNLYKLVSDGHLKHFYGHPRIPKSLLTRRREGLLIGSACERGEVFEAIVKGESRERLAEIAAFYDYLEIQPLCNNAFMIGGKARDEEQLRDFNREVVKLGRDLGKPVAATGDTHFLEPEDAVYRAVLQANMNMLKDKPTPLYFKTTTEMLEEFSYLGAETAYKVVVETPNALADSIERVQPIRSGEYFPVIPGAAEELNKLTYDGMKRVYGDAWPPMLKERLEKELNCIIGHGYAVIYISAQRLVARSEEKGYKVGSRGSVGSSIVAYFAGITEVNALPPHYRCPACRHWEFPDHPTAACGPDLPDKLCPVCQAPYIKDGYDISFAIFLGFDADKKPDIDLNFSGEYQLEAHKHALEIFGASNVYKAGTISTLGEKTALMFAGKYLDKMGDSMDGVEKEWLASGCVGVRRSTGQHPGGLIIVPEDMDINEFCPVQHPANKSESGQITTHFDYHSIDENLLKLDLLGHDNPTIIKMMEDITGRRADQIPLGDPEVMRLFTDSAVLGYQNDELLGPTGAVAIPEFGTRFVRGMLTDAQPKTFDDLLRISGLSHGEMVWQNNAQDLIKSGTATLREVVGTRDDILDTLVRYGMDRKQAFLIMERVRKGKGLAADQEEAMRAAKVAEWYIESCKKIHYLFPKSHAVAYVIAAFQIAWYKVNCPLAFYSAYFSIRAKAFELDSMANGLTEAKKRFKVLSLKPDRTALENAVFETVEVVYEYYLRGLSFLPIDLYASDAERFVLEDGKLRLPFIAVGGLGEVAAAELVKERARPFLSIDDVNARCGKLNKQHIEKLRELGVFRGLPETMQMTLF